MEVILSIIKNISWKQVVTFVAGLAGTYEAYQEVLPDWAKVGGGVLIGAAINTKLILEKRKKGAPTFDSAKAAEKAGL